jgi:hypothetical protein
MADHREADRNARRQPVHHARDVPRKTCHYEALNYAPLGREHCDQSVRVRHYRLWERHSCHVPKAFPNSIRYSIRHSKTRSGDYPRNYVDFRWSCVDCRSMNCVGYELDRPRSRLGRRNRHWRYSGGHNRNPSLPR